MLTGYLSWVPSPRIHTRRYFILFGSVEIEFVPSERTKLSFHRKAQGARSCTCLSVLECVHPCLCARARVVFACMCATSKRRGLCAAAVAAQQQVGIGTVLSVSEREVTLPSAVPIRAARAAPSAVSATESAHC